ncbi:MAG: NAD-dependent epimerase/dehydratase family protein [Pirellulaceae bacterium]|nr:NAD-dependent epimerase/dehydratase family protein [Pirellulaceae bacterium]
MFQWQDEKVLVTGGAGQIGANLVRRLNGLGADVTVADNLWRGKRSNLIVDGSPLIDFDTRFHELDLIDYQNCLRVVQGQSTVYHLADVVAGINYVFGNQLSLFATNVVMNSNILRAAIAAGVKRYVYVGTACSYPAEKQSQLNPPPFKEEDAYPASPESSYGWSKLMGEYECQLAQRENLIDVGVLRFHNVYGPCCEMSPEKSQVIPALIRKACNYPNEPFVVWGSGRQRRAFVFVEDVVDALVSVVERGMNQGVIQIGPDRSESIADVAATIVALTKKNIVIEFDTSKPEGDTDRTADWSKAKRILDWSPRTDIRSGLTITMQWCRDRIPTA